MIWREKQVKILLLTLTYLVSVIDDSCSGYTYIKYGDKIGWAPKWIFKKNRI